MPDFYEDISGQKSPVSTETCVVYDERKEALTEGEHIRLTNGIEYLITEVPWPIPGDPDNIGYELQWMV